MIENLEDMAGELQKRARAAGFNLQGPVATDLGYGGPPVVTFWAGDRRTHFYFGTYAGAIAVMVEASQVAPEPRVQVGRLQTAEEAWKIVDRFLRFKRAFDDLPDLEWVQNVPTIDGSIPHPPDKPNPLAAGTTPLVGSFKKSAPAPQASSAARVEIIGGVTLYSTDPARLAEWYRDALGFDLTRQGDSYAGAVGGLPFSIFASESPLPQGVRAMITWRVNDFDAFVLKLAGKGVAIDGLDATKAGKFAYVRDGDGNPVEIWGVQ